MSQILYFFQQSIINIKINLSFIQVLTLGFGALLSFAGVYTYSYIVNKNTRNSSELRSQNNKTHTREQDVLYRI